MMRDAVGGDLAGGSSGHERSAARERAHPDLIVIGSLVDRLPNLGTFLFLVPELFSIWHPACLNRIQVLQNK